MDYRQTIPMDLQIELGKLEHRNKLKLLHREYINSIGLTFTHCTEDYIVITNMVDYNMKFTPRWVRRTSVEIQSVDRYHSIKDAKKKSDP